MRVSRIKRRAAIAAPLVLLAAAAVPAAAQGTGSSGAGVLQLLAGGRAAALSGAYSAAGGDVDVLFYNPAGIATLRSGAALSYQRHVQDIGVASAAAAFRVGRFSIGAGGVFLDAGSINVLVPDPAFGGQTGMESGATASATEFAGRVTFAMSLGERTRVGGAVGAFSATLADATRSAALFDVGAQYDLARVTLAASARNLGGPVTGGGLADAELPSEARIGALARLSAGGIGAIVSGDIVSRFQEERTGFAIGLEAGLLPESGRQGIGAVARAGFNAMEGQNALGSLQLGAGLSSGAFSLDYAFQHYEYFGALHRFGVRWSRQ
jgi:hypothetical protein